jgi:ectoine hydroxylase-related dioxygenase (phytanoyl-CoA dioxygenase family)
MTTPSQSLVDRAVVDQMDELGYAVIPGVLDQHRVALLRAELEAAIAADNMVFDQVEQQTGRPHPDRWMVQNAMLRGIELGRMLEQETMQAYFSEFVGEHCILYAYQTSSLPPHGANYSARLHVDTPRLVPGYMTNIGAFFPLDDLTEENGATYLLPGSHKSLEGPDEATFEANAVRMICPAGSMVLIHPRVWHRGGSNRTSRARHMLTIGACRNFMRSRFDFPRLIDNTKSDILTNVGAVGRRFLGYNVRVPASMEEYYRPPESRLYLANQG